MSKKRKRTVLWLGVVCLIGVILALTPIRSYASDEVVIDENSFPDAAFREYVHKTIDNGDGILTEEEMNGVTKIVVPYLDNMK